MNKPLICTCCGAKINRATMRCEYCGTEYREEHGVPVIRYESFQNPVQEFGATVLMSEWETRENPHEAMEYALHRLAQKMLPAVVAGMKVKSEFDPEHMAYRITGRVRVVLPNERGINGGLN